MLNLLILEAEQLQEEREPLFQEQHEERKPSIKGCFTQVYDKGCSPDSGIDHPTLFVIS